MKKREITLRWDEYEVGDLVCSANKKAGLEPGLVYEVAEFLGPYTASVSDPHLSGGVCLKDEEGNLKVTSAEWIRPANWWIEVRIDETHHWIEGREIRKLLEKEDGRAYCIYVYNEMEHMHLCELQPSYYLVSAYNYTTVPMPECLQDDFEAVNQAADCDVYFHVRHIDALPESDKLELGIFGCLGETSEEIEEQIREYVQCNPNWC